MDLRELNQKVTDAIWRAERLPPGTTERAAAFRGVSRLEEQIAELCHADTVEGAYARDGAVRAALLAKEHDRALALAAQYAAEPKATGRLRECLARLIRDGA
jgi:hypothetical protein